MKLSCEDILFSTYKDWRIMKPSNAEYVSKHNLDACLVYTRPLYVPYQRILILSGHNEILNQTSRKCFQFFIFNQEMQTLPSIRYGRNSYACLYVFEDPYAYAIGGTDIDSNQTYTCLKSVERFDI